MAGTNPALRVYDPLDDESRETACAASRRPRRRTARPCCAGRARAAGVRHRPALAPQPAALPGCAECRTPGGGGTRRLGRYCDRAVSAAVGGGAPLFHCGRPAYGRPRGRLDPAAGRGRLRAPAPLRLDPARSARDQRRGHFALPEERLPGVRPPLPLLRGWRRRAAVREAAYPRNFLVRLMPRARIVSGWDNPTDTWRLTLFRPNTGPHRGRSRF